MLLRTTMLLVATALPAATAQQPAQPSGCQTESQLLSRLTVELQQLRLAVSRNSQRTNRVAIFVERIRQQDQRVERLRHRIESTEERLAKIKEERAELEAQRRTMETMMRAAAAQGADGPMIREQADYAEKRGASLAAQQEDLEQRLNRMNGELATEEARSADLEAQLDALTKEQD